MRISETTKDAIYAISIDRIIEPYVDFVKKSGRNGLMACCPFHNEKTPSFVVNIDKGFFKCFGCGVGGNGVSFIMQHQNLSYVDALLFIAEKFGITVEYVGENNKNYNDIKSLHNDIQIELRKNLYSEDGLDAKKYILSRSFSDEDLNEFGIGFIAPKQNFKDLLKKYKKDVLLKSGFFRENNYGIYSHFFNRLTLPIKNITGTINAFAGRSIDGSMPKYINSSDSEIFHKGNTLFNIDKAKSVMKSNGCIVVEGYFDVIRLHQIGIKNAVAPMGTALTKNQASLIKRYCDDVTVVFDGDSAGEKAAYRSLSIFIESGIFPKAIFLPEGEDPDSFCLKESNEGWNNLFEKRNDLFISIAEKLVVSSENDFNKKLIRFKSVKNMLAMINDNHLRDYYTDIMADIFGLRKENIDHDIIEEKYKKQHSKVSKADSNVSNTIYLCERDFITSLFFLQIDVIDSLIFDMTDEMFNDLYIRNLFKKILDVYTKITDIRELVHELDSYFIDVISRDIDYDPYKFALTNKNQIVRNYLIRKKATLIEEVKKENNIDKKTLLLQELQEITNKLLCDADYGD